MESIFTIHSLYVYAPHAQVLIETKKSVLGPRAYKGWTSYVGLNKSIKCS